MISSIGLSDTDGTSRSKQNIRASSLLIHPAECLPNDNMGNVREDTFMTGGPSGKLGLGSGSSTRSASSLPSKALREQLLLRSYLKRRPASDVLKSMAMHRDDETVWSHVTVTHATDMSHGLYVPITWSQTARLSK